MILADTSVWVDHFRKRDAELYQQLQRGNISIHPFVITELALGALPERRKTLASLDLLPAVKVAQANEVREMIDARSLFRRGLGFVDAHLIASTFITAHTVLWTRDKRLREATEAFGLSAGFP